jgi:F-type H+-transporting ATPase subunit b
MTVLLLNLLFVFAGNADSFSYPESGFGYYYQQVKPYIDYPGFELWKFINLGIYVAILIYFVRKPLSEGFKQKREAIRTELIRAEEVRKTALAELAEVDARIAGLEREKVRMLEESKMEAATEENRINTELESEITHLYSQAENEIARRAQQSELELRRLAANESVRLAKEKIKSQMTPEKDSALVGDVVSSMGGAK